jgi:hypothetical protein
MKGDVVSEGGRVSHEVYCAERAHVKEALTFWSKGLGAEFEPIELEGSGLRILFSEDGGDVIIAPTDDADDRRTVASRFLAEHGEGAFGVAHSVHSLDDVTASMGQVGGDVVRRVIGIRTQKECNHVSKELTVERGPCYRVCK